MNKINEEAIKAFYNAEKFSKQNTKVEVLPNVTTLSLHGNIIAYRYNDPQKTLTITNCGWFTKTTKDRLNGLDGVEITQKKNIWYLNGKKWNGEIIDVHIDQKEKIYTKKQREKIYLDYINNFLTVDNFADAYDMRKNEAENFIKESKELFNQ